MIEGTKKSVHNFGELHGLGTVYLSDEPFKLLLLPSLYQEMR